MTSHAMVLSHLPDNQQTKNKDSSALLESLETQVYIVLIVSPPIDNIAQKIFEAFFIPKFMNLSQAGLPAKSSCCRERPRRPTTEYDYRAKHRAFSSVQDPCFGSLLNWRHSHFVSFHGSKPSSPNFSTTNFVLKFQRLSPSSGSLA